MVCAANVQVGRSWSTSPLRNGNQTRPKPDIAVASLRATPRQGARSGLTDPATVRLIRDRASARGLADVVEAAGARLAELVPTKVKAPKAQTVKPRRKSRLIAG